MKQIQIPVEIKVTEIPSLNTAVAKELKLDDNKELFMQFVKGSGDANT